MKIKEAVAIIDRLGIGSRGYRNLEEAIKTVVEFARTQPEIIRCGECKHYKIDHPKANGYHCCYRCHNIFPMKETDFCSKAERRNDEQRTGD